MEKFAIRVTADDRPELSKTYRAELFDQRTYFEKVLAEIEACEDCEEEEVLRNHAKKIAVKFEGSHTSAKLMKYNPFAERCAAAEMEFGMIETKSIIEWQTYVQMLRDLVEEFEQQIRVVEADYELEPVEIL